MLRAPRPRSAWLLGGLAPLLVLLAGLPPPPVAQGSQPSSSGRPYPVAIAPGNQHWPAAYGDAVVWLDDAENRPIIRANDLRTGNELRLSREGAVPAGPPVISGQLAVWPDYRGDTPTTPWPEPHLYAYDLSARTDFILSPVPGRQAEPRIDGSLVVWTDYRADPDKGDIYGYDLSTRREFPVLVDAAHQAQPAVSGQIVVWQDWRSGQAQIYATDRGTGEVWPLTPEPGPYERPLVSGQRAVWLDSSGGTPRVAVYDLVARTALAPVQSRSPLALEGNALVGQSATGDAIVLYDLVTGATTPLATLPAGAPEVWASLGAGTVAWTDYRNSELQWQPAVGRLTNQDIFVARLNQPPLPAGSRPNIPYRAASPERGVTLQVWGAPAATPAHLQRTLAAGFGWQKTRIPWAEIETRKGQFNWSETDRLIQASQTAALQVIARVDVSPRWARPDNNPHGPPLNYGDYSDFIYALMQRYRTGSPYGRIAAIEVWNEPNLQKDWGDLPVNRQQAADYTRLLQGAYQAAKRADPNVTVVSAALSPTGWNDETARPDDVYLHWLYQAGFASWFDALGVHGLGYRWAPETVPTSAEGYSHPSFYFRRVEQMREIMVQYGDADKQIWLTEFGWHTDPVHPTFSWFRVTEEEKGDYIVRAYRLAQERWAPWIGVMTLWTMPDPRWTTQQEQYYWAILEPDGTERASYRILVDAYRGGLLPRR
jgi:polysaccharide biosynthesis protein PslG